MVALTSSGGGTATGTDAATTCESPKYYPVAYRKPDDNERYALIGFRVVCVIGGEKP
jgi:hypothetical protein